MLVEASKESKREKMAKYIFKRKKGKTREEKGKKPGLQVLMGPFIIDEWTLHAMKRQ